MQSNFREETSLQSRGGLHHAPGERVCSRRVYGVDSVLVNLPGGNPGLASIIHTKYSYVPFRFKGRINFADKGVRKDEERGRSGIYGKSGR